MAWVQVGTHKINTAVICYIEQAGEVLRLYFHGQWEGNPLDLHFDEAKAFWRHLKAEDVMIGKDKGSATMLPKVGSGGGGSNSTGAYAVSHRADDEKEKPKAPTAPGTQAPSHQTKQGEHRKH
jgi:hypothetical protein